MIYNFPKWYRRIGLCLGIFCGTICLASLIIAVIFISANNNTGIILGLSFFIIFAIPCVISFLPNEHEKSKIMIDENGVAYEDKKVKKQFSWEDVGRAYCLSLVSHGGYGWGEFIILQTNEGKMINCLSTDTVKSILFSDHTIGIAYTPERYRKISQYVTIMDSWGV